MKREILFRGKKIDSGEWIYGNLEYVSSEGADYYYIFWQGHTTPVIADTIGQYTGTEDRNGVKIFDGDVIDEGIVCWNDEYLGFFAKGDFAEGENKPLYDILFPEIVGNIHDNPDKK
jgi:uncharacterized phage protein (TIGR01671 family)